MLNWIGKLNIISFLDKEDIGQMQTAMTARKLIVNDELSSKDAISLTERLSKVSLPLSIDEVYIAASNIIDKEGVSYLMALTPAELRDAIEEEFRNEAAAILDSLDTSHPEHGTDKERPTLLVKQRCERCEKPFWVRYRARMADGIYVSDGHDYVGPYCWCEGDFTPEDGDMPTISEWVENLNKSD